MATTMFFGLPLSGWKPTESQATSSVPWPSCVTFDRATEGAPVKLKTPSGTHWFFITRCCSARLGGLGRSVPPTLYTAWRVCAPWSGRCT